MSPEQVPDEEKDAPLYESVEMDADTVVRIWTDEDFRLFEEEDQPSKESTDE